MKTAQHDRAMALLEARLNLWWSRHHEALRTEALAVLDKAHTQLCVALARLETLTCVEGAGGGGDQEAREMKDIAQAGDEAWDLCRKLRAKGARARLVDRGRGGDQ